MHIHEEKKSLIYEKTVAIRGVDKSLYDLFISITKYMGRNVGYFFTRLIQHYQKEIPPFFGPPRMIKIFNKAFESLEIIENQEELIVTKEDLIIAGENVKYYFKDIKKLIFDETIDNKSLFKHVYRIKDCTETIMPEDISQLIMNSIKRVQIFNKPKLDNLKDITIRNVDVTIYEEFVSSCQLNNEKIGDAVNNIFLSILPEIEVSQLIIHELHINPLDVLVISSLEEVFVQEKDLQDIDKRKVLFHRIKKLEFDQDIKKTSFIDHIIGIFNCEDVILPTSLPKLISLSRNKKFP
ncbi:MAG: hypothetical protein ACXAC7_07410 [Candidatus Hodarchaeales archaeon]|jgi:hypothetical protein